jgi:hypothetical protein
MDPIRPTDGYAAQPSGRAVYTDGAHVFTELAHLAVQTVDLLKELLAGVRRVGRQEVEALPQEGAAPHAEEIAHLEVVQGVLGQGGVNPILELRALPDEYHPVRGRSRWSRNAPGRIQTVAA